MNWIKRQCRKVAGWLVTIYYRRMYDKAVRYADERHRKEGEMMYVIDHLVKGQTLTVINRREFRRMKHDAQKYTFRKVDNYLMYWSNEYNLQLVKDGSWYHTADRSEKNGLSETDRQARKTVFIRLGLMRAKLIDKI